jgi:hypothetical protein
VKNNVASNYVKKFIFERLVARSVKADVFWYRNSRMSVRAGV